MRTTALFILVLLFALVEARAQNGFAEIEAHQQRLDRVTGSILASQGRMLQSAPMTSAQANAYDLMAFAKIELTETSIGLTSLSDLMSMQRLVTGEGQVGMARKIVDLKREYIREIAAKQAGYVETLITKTNDSETSRLLIESRDALKATSELLKRK